MNYIQARNLLSKSRKGRVRLPGAETYLESLDDSHVVIKYWNTPIVVIDDQDHYTLNTNGHRTSTTKKKINFYAPVNVFQRDYTWYLSGFDFLTKFEDRVTVNRSGQLINNLAINFI